MSIRAEELQTADFFANEPQTTLPHSEIIHPELLKLIQDFQSVHAAAIDGDGPLGRAIRESEKSNSTSVVQGLHHDEARKFLNGRRLTYKEISAKSFFELYEVMVIQAHASKGKVEEAVAKFKGTRFELKKIQTVAESTRDLSNKALSAKTDSARSAAVIPHMESYIKGTGEFYLSEVDYSVYECTKSLQELAVKMPKFREGIDEIMHGADSIEEADTDKKKRQKLYKQAKAAFLLLAVNDSDLNDENMKILKKIIVRNIGMEVIDASNLAEKAKTAFLLEILVDGIDQSRVSVQFLKGMVKDEISHHAQLTKNPAQQIPSYV